MKLGSFKETRRTIVISRAVPLFAEIKLKLKRRSFYISKFTVRYVACYIYRIASCHCTSNCYKHHTIKIFYNILKTLRARATLATFFNHMWPRIVADPSTLGRHVAATCMLCMQTLCLWRGRATACRTLEPQTAVCSPKLENNGFLRE